MIHEPLRMISRESFLAMAQTLRVAQYLKENSFDVTIQTCVTGGDKFLDSALYKLVESKSETNHDGKALFTKELEDKMLAGEADIAVHSLKDLPTDLPEGLEFTGVMLPDFREDILLTRAPLPLRDESPYIPSDFVVATSSLRRIAQIRYGNPRVKTANIRGNLITRLRKLLQKEVECDGLVLARAGYVRLLEFQQNWPRMKPAYVLASDLLDKLEEDYQKLTELLERPFFVYRFAPNEFIPAPGQGILGIENKKINGNSTLTRLKDRIDQDFGDQRIFPYVERTLLSGLGAGCHVPFAAYCREKAPFRKAPKTRVYEVDTFYAPDFHPEQGFPKTPLRLSRFLPLEKEKIHRYMNMMLAELKCEAVPIVFTGKNFSKFQELIPSQIPTYHVPLVESVPTNEPPPEGFDPDIIVFSSFSAASFLMERTGDQFIGKPVLAVGPGTAEKIEKIDFFESPQTPKTFDSAGMSDWILSSPYKKILWVGAYDGILDGVERVRHQKEVMFYAPYQNHSLTRREVMDRIPSEIKGDSRWVFTSPSGVRAYAAADIRSDEHYYFALGNSTAAELIRQDLPVYHMASQSELKVLARELTGIAEARRLTLEEINKLKR